MAKKQTRRSISTSKSFFERMKRYCDRNSIPMSAFLEFSLEGDLSRPLTRAAYEHWRIGWAIRMVAAQEAAAKRARHAAGLARVRASGKHSDDHSKN